MKVAIILNGISRRKKFFYTTLLPAIQKIAETVVYETQFDNHALQLAHEAVEKRYDVVLAAGGDGTLHQVLNGILKNKKIETDLPALGVIPLGSGNDFARTFHIRANRAAIEKMLRSTPALMDVGNIQYHSEDNVQEAYFINVADAGMGPEVIHAMQNSKKPFGAAVAYYVAILSTFFTYRCMRVQVKTPAWEWTNNLRTLAIGNGKFYGHGLCIAPDALVTDGQLDVFLCGDVSVWDFIRYSSALKSSKKIKHTKVSYSSAKTLVLSSDTPCRIEADGELLGYLPATIDVVPNRIRFLGAHEA